MEPFKKNPYKSLNLLGSVQIATKASSCSALKLQGVTTSGIYALQDENQAPRLGFCDMELNGYLDAELEKSIGVLEAFPDPGRIMFSAYRDNQGEIAVTGDLTFNHQDENVGGHLDLATGVFTSPVDGTFKFTFSGLGYYSNSDHVDVYVNDERVFGIHNGDDGAATNLAYSWFLELQTNDKVKLYSVYNLIVNSVHSYHFTCIQLK